MQLKHLHCVRMRLAGGTIKSYYYHRRTRRRIVGKYGSPEFIESYVEASKVDRQNGESTLGNLITLYRESSDFTELAPRTRSDYDKILAHIDGKWGGMPLRVFDAKGARQQIRKERDRIATTNKRRSDYFISVLSVVSGFGIDIDLLTQNPCKGLKKRYKVDRSDNIWLPHHVAGFRAVASPELQLALSLALHTGQRQGDLLILPWSAYDGQAIKLRQRKTKTKVYIPGTSALKSALSNAPKRALTVLTNQSGAPWTEHGFRSSWRKACKAAGITGLTFHDLRGTAVTMLAEAGCTTPEIAAITGHSTRGVNNILDKYLALTKPLANAAIVKLDLAQRRNESST